MGGGGSGGMGMGMGGFNNPAAAAALLSSGFNPAAFGGFWSSSNGYGFWFRI